MESPKKRKREEETGGTDQATSQATSQDDSTATIKRALAVLAAPTTESAPQQLREVVQSLLNLHLRTNRETITRATKKVAARSLSAWSALQAFNLEQATHHIEQVEVVEPPQWVLDCHALAKRLVINRAKNGEAYARLLLDPVITAVLIHQTQRSKDFARKNDHSEPFSLRLVLEDHLQAEALVDGENVIIQGKADYAIYYDDEPYVKHPENGQVHTNFEAGIVAIEAKKINHVHEALAQLIVYMGMIYRERKKRGKDNCTVWGFASDGHEYIFTRVDELGRFRKSMIKRFDEEGRGNVFGTLCSIFDAAALSSPNTSPIKGRQAHQRVIALFRSPERAGQFDYGISKEVLGAEAASAATDPEADD